MQSTRKLTPLRCIIGLVLFALTVPALTVAVMAVGLSFVPAGLVALVTLIVVGRWVMPFLPLDLGGRSFGRRVLLLVWVVLTLVAAHRLERLSRFMHDVENTSYAFNPTIRKLDAPELAKPFFPKHNCFTCYIVAAYLAGERVDNLYDRKFYRRAEVTTPIHRQIGESLHVDGYQYPPPFLILPRLLVETGGDFYQLRAYWFALNVVGFITMIGVLLFWIGGQSFNAYWLGLPVILLAPVTIGTLQIENVHLLIVVISMLSLPAFGKRWFWLGGALLGFAIVSKLFPVLLLLFLLLQRRWRAVFWTAGWMAAYGLLALLMFGPKPYEAFFGFQLPRLISGEAFSFATTHLGALVKNASVPGIAYKLAKLGLVSQPETVSRFLVWGLTIAQIAVLLFVGLRRYDWQGDTQPSRSFNERRLGLARIWLALLLLGQLRSPFLPWGYGNVPALLLVVLLIPLFDARRGEVWKTALLIPAWAILATVIPLPWGPPTVALDLIVTLGGLCVVLVCCAIIVLQRPIKPVLQET